MKNTATTLKIFIIIFIILTLVSPLFAIGSIICSVKLKKYDEVNGNRFLTASIIAAVIFMILHFMYYLTYFF
ncbi:hypothetical protein [Staphylococcus carnosus]|uniref:Membrane protein n=2 Tax=Staphylococcus carnosus TaxID=1281 RepID=B9DIZ7_STACT|nr:hypothetical protein [Staphylococcus carnosus]ANZ33859.1 hypothetical protein BEK99_08695 [Staphylococcus carnosus]KKB24768.1 membrane protein [Staphylococcus carnosus]KOR14101.1 hypothetical protein AMC75_04315 [Staphylococcus carnosus]POA02703.1 hypothetical protein CD153_06090 [Staphylococcus carnosus]QPT03615.1 hypothetical protein I6G40_11115 [Staphylococcus carnosus]